MMQQIPERCQKYVNTRNRTKKRTRTMVRTKKHPTNQTTRIMAWRERRFQQDTAATSSSSPREKRTETQENVFAKRRLKAKSPNRPITLVPPPEDPVTRRLLKKTDTRKDESVMNVHENLVNVVNTLTNTRTCHKRIRTKTTRCRS